MIYEIEFYETTRHVYKVDATTKEKAELLAETVYYDLDNDVRDVELEKVVFVSKENTENEIGTVIEVEE